MISAKKFLSKLLALDFNHFTGVPDSTLESVLDLLDNDQVNFINRIAPNEGSAIAIASGYYLSTGKLSIVYMQNSGLGNAINPLTSLADGQVYKIPMLLIIGWRGMIGFPDEPQHKKMGIITEGLLKTVGVKYFILDEMQFEEQLLELRDFSIRESKPSALIVKPKTFSSFGHKRQHPKIGIIREKAIELISSKLGKNDIVFSTTGKTSREFFEITENLGKGHNFNFYNVGSMGHVSSIALEVSLQKNRNTVYVLDGDGASIMHLGAISNIGHYKPKNMVHILFNNLSHESTGGQATSSSSVDWEKLFYSCGYSRVFKIFSMEDLENFFYLKKDELTAVIISTQIFSRKDLGRPSDAPIDTKLRFMNSLKGL